MHKAFLPESISNCCLTWNSELVINLGTKSTWLSFGNIDDMGFTLDGNPALLDESCVYHPPLEPDLHPSLDLLAL